MLRALHVLRALQMGACVVPLLVAAACSSTSTATPDTALQRTPRPVRPATPSPIEHVVIVVQENHTFDGHFGRYCSAPAGSVPTCTTGPACCEAPPATEPSGSAPIVLDDDANGSYDPNHTQACELVEIDDGKMDHFVTGGDSNCSNPNNFAIAAATVVNPYHDYASQYAIADRYFQSIAGQSSANDMYLAVAKFVFLDNTVKPDATGKECNLTEMTARFDGTTIADLLVAKQKTINFYAEGYAAAKASPGQCPKAPDDCGLGLPLYPCSFDPGDIPFLYYKQFATSPDFMKDYGELAGDLSKGTLPDVAYVKAIGYRSEHPGYKTALSPGVAFVDNLVKSILASSYKDNTLVLVTWDEGGGYFDHVSPPATNPADGKPYGTRVPLLALGRFAKENYVSHVPMEHSSIVKFLEWNFLGGMTGQLGGRDANVNNLGSLLDPTQTVTPVPEN
ncbi:MAG: Acid phosphatase [Myxococcaceae bacterium]|nr:Acid phosphatase [Myxococcaceae bacterium]